MLPDSTREFATCRIRSVWFKAATTHKKARKEVRTDPFLFVPCCSQSPPHAVAAGETLVAVERRATTSLGGYGREFRIPVICSLLNARSVFVRTLPLEPRLSSRAVAVSSSGASKIRTPS